MASTISDFFSSVPPTSQLYAPSEVQQPNDFDSAATSTSTESDSLTISRNIDWSRLHGFVATPRLSKRPKSWIYLYGTRIRQETTNKEYWLCHICHNQRPLPQRPNNHIYRCASTTTSIGHLHDRHRITENGQIPIESQRITQPSIRAYSDLLQERNDKISAFSMATFKALLIKLFTMEHLSFIKVDSAAFRELLEYLQPSLRAIYHTGRL